MTKEVKLTEYSHGAGCGCKISPAVLTQILESDKVYQADPRLLVGNDTRDDAAVYALDDERLIISTTDFFMPIVDNPEDFGGIASVNAISDIYAMGGKPIMAIAILGWPVNKLDTSIAARVMEGAREACSRAGISVAGGHSIDAPEPIFGLAVTGTVLKKNLKRNDGATAGCELYLTKALGVGLFTTAQKRGKLLDEDFATVRASMLALNDFGAELSDLEAVKSVTDVTGFGLLGHLSELCEGSGVKATIRYSEVPKLPGLERYLDLGTMPGGTTRNFESYGHKVSELSDTWKAVLCDPQTSGGLLVAVEPSGRDAFLEAAKERGLELDCFGTLSEAGDSLITVTE
ncbi:MAG: selenide, water dikinase SelD [Deltaproteobacteria bacterium]|nr:selenide, water dikinase SelD [Deltaproteobacteria bacterium]